MIQAVAEAFPRRGKLQVVALTGGLVFVLSAGPAHAADFDIDNLPAPDPQALSASIISWTDSTTSQFSTTSWTDALTSPSSITTWSLESAVVDLEEITKEAGQTVVTLDADILFEFAKAVLPPAAHARIAKTVAKAPRGSAVSIGGHTDNVGSGPANITLSGARTQAVALAVKTARPDLALTVRGFGESKPVASNGDAVGGSKNRRVEVRFVG